MPTKRDARIPWGTNGIHQKATILDRAEYRNATSSKNTETIAISPPTLFGLALAVAATTISRTAAVKQAPTTFGVW
jgi:hypothetical protein